MSACTGKCCAVFNYSVTLDVLRGRDDAESKFLADMLIELTPEEAAERVERFSVALPEGCERVEDWTGQHAAYTCRHWDEDTMLCTVYEDRPRMCRDYPYARACQHDDCCQYRPPEVIQNIYRPPTKVWEGDYA